MLYKFHSRAAPDLIMLQAHGQRLLTLIGKHNEERRGILRTEEMPAAIAALEKAIADEKTDTQEDEAKEPDISLRQRATPFIEMMRRCLAEGADMVWGV